ncbi:hypothetical protein [Caulobacter sp. UNC279MFTsu5.1]|uniref:hypothetical protein n=1 Tax=Caulobacter sp. UNC279MFTsu5.1 TaxID=1502775 RepID=UPI001160D199|nr:hypothetical protein [Caulobacter sp. UNC279MFTsu5.1]
MKKLVFIAACILAATTSAVAAPQKTRPTPKPAVAKPRAGPAPAPKPHVIPETGTLTNGDLVAIAKLAAKGSADQFSDDPSRKYLGRDFIAVFGNDELRSSYDKETKTLTISTSEYSKGWELDGERKYSEYTGQNSYGAKATITKIEGKIYGVEIPGKQFSRKPFKFLTQLDGEAARTLSKAVLLRISGTIREATGVYADKGSIVSKPAILHDATISEPTDTFVMQYFIAADITKVEFIDPRSGEVIYTTTDIDKYN